MTKKLVPALVVALLAAAVASSAFATTRPAIIINVRVNVSDNAMTFSQYRAQRGWGVHFIVRNIGKKPHKVDIGGLVTPVLLPGKRARVSASLEERGRFPFKVTVNSAGPRHTGWFTVF